jgi:hypothetical protein
MIGWIGKELEGIVHGIIKVHPQHLPGGTE